MCIIQLVIKMKKNQSYIYLAGFFILVLMGTMIYKYPSVHFQLHNQSTLEKFDYQAENEKVVIKHYFSTNTPYHGGAVLEVKEDLGDLTNAYVEVQYDNQILKHSIQPNSEHSYTLDLLEQANLDVRPQSFKLLNEEGTILTEGSFIDGENHLYQGLTPDYACFNVYVNGQGIYPGQFNAYKPEKMTQLYDRVTLEYCQIDASKSSGYRLLGREELALTDYLNQPRNAWVPFLQEASFTQDEPLELVITFTGSNTYTMVITLNKGVA